MAQETILIVDDEAGIRESLSGVLEDEGYEVITAASGEDALTVAREQAPDLIFLDVWLSGMDGLETLALLRESEVKAPVVMISGHGNIEMAVKATKSGAYDFLEKPLSLERVLIVARRALERKVLERENRSLKADIIRKCRLIGDSAGMKLLKQQIEMAAQSSSRVLILGESGTGKELVARLLHERSPREKCPFVDVNCAAIPHELIESELFGHEKGAFTGATERKNGKFEMADRGTIFLDEIGDMALPTQAKVLRAIEAQSFQRVGGNRTITVDVRIISATNKDLQEEVRKGNFREDLFFRLNVIPLQVPPLRERKDDIPLLALHFMEAFASEHGLRQKRITEDALRALQGYDWPGNIRELDNLMQRTMILQPNTVIEVDALHFENTATHSARPEAPCLGDDLKSREQELIIDTLQSVMGNRQAAASRLGISPRTLRDKLARLRKAGITIPNKYPADLFKVR
ncbi:MAG: sigma-54-dependent Fis family transcriptional regulator [Nitrospirales bacterium]|nr:sigma-54-dependent Fis family transcriptional regulator [Nitrospirales bacterium]